MSPPNRPRDGNQLAKLVVDMATGQIPNDKDEILNPPEPSGHASSAKARREPDAGAASRDRAQGGSGALGEVASL